MNFVRCLEECGSLFPDHQTADFLLFGLILIYGKMGKVDFADNINITVKHRKIKQEVYNDQ